MHFRMQLPIAILFLLDKFPEVGRCALLLEFKSMIRRERLDQKKKFDRPGHLLEYSSASHVMSINGGFVGRGP
jgi:hypothetical protein